MQIWIVQMMEQYGYIGIFALILLENVFPPIPSELILTFGGFMTTKSGMNVVLMILFSTIASTVGALILYAIGHLLQEERLIRLVTRYRILGVKPADIQKVMNWYRRYQYKTIFFCRMIPVLRSLISIPAGISKMSMTPFLTLTAAGSLIWNTLLIGAGALLGENWNTILYYMDIYSHIVYVLFGIAGILGVVYWYRKQRRSLANPKADVDKAKQ